MQPEVPMIWLLVVGVGGIALGIAVEKARTQNLRVNRRARRAFKRVRRDQPTNSQEQFTIWSSDDDWSTARNEGGGNRDEIIALYAELDENGDSRREFKICSKGEVPTRERNDVLGRIDG